jgi:aminoglycoside phosphotransferase family enzyme
LTASQAPERTGRDLKEKVAFLRRPQAYPDESAAVNAVETHMSWVFLTGRLAFKLKKPARYDFLDLRSQDSRRRSCEDEVRLNRRLAPEIYLGTVPLTEDADGALAVGGIGEPVDWLVKMRRLPAERMLDQAIRAGGVKTRELRTVAGLLARFFNDAVPVAMPPAEYRRRLANAVTTYRRTLADPSRGMPVRSVAKVTATLRKVVMGEAPLFDRRIRRGRIREGHGDLRAEHVFLGPKAAVIDCLDYNRDLRIQDSADELCLLAIECEILGTPGAGKVILETCCDRLGDEPPPELIAFYKARRAMMRASSALLHSADGSAGDSAVRRGWAETYLALAEQYARQLG